MSATFFSYGHRFTKLLGVAALAGCSGFLPDLPADYAIATDLNSGLIVGSVGTNPLGKQWREWSQYQYRSITDAKLRGYVTSAVNWSNPFYPQPECPDDGLPAECGHLFAIILPVGEYEFWAVIPARDSNSADRSFTQSGWATHLQGYRFEVKSGQAAYVGNMLSRLCGGSSHSYYGIAQIGSARVAQGDVADMYVRDMPLIRQKFPQLQNTPVSNEAMHGLAWRWEYKQPPDTSLAANWQSECAPLRTDISKTSDANSNQTSSGTSITLTSQARRMVSFRDVEDLLSERGIKVSYETVRRWSTRFGPACANRLRKRAGCGGNQWFVDELIEPGAFCVDCRARSAISDVADFVF